MKRFLIACLVLAATGCNLVACKAKTEQNSLDKTARTVKAVNPSYFITNDTNLIVTTVDCTLSDGSTTKCLEIRTKSIPSDHEMGPWCPHTIDEKEASGRWFKDGKMYEVNGEFIQDLANLYHDDEWLLYDEEGHVYRTDSQEDCEQLAGAQLIDEFKNYCIECLPEYVSSLSKTYTIPLTPVLLDKPLSLNGHPGGGGSGRGGPPKGARDSHNADGHHSPPPQGKRPKGPPPGGGRGGPMARGIAFNGVVFDAPAPTALILSGYTIPPIDPAGGHINLDAGYHYHAATGASKNIEQEDNHAPMIGYAIDGFGLYANLNANQEEPNDLDECRGHYDAQRGYHYHVDAAGNNNFINCFKGAIAQ